MEDVWGELPGTAEEAPRNCESHIGRPEKNSSLRSEVCHGRISRVQTNRPAPGHQLGKATQAQNFGEGRDLSITAGGGVSKSPCFAGGCLPVVSYS